MVVVVAVVVACSRGIAVVVVVAMEHCMLVDKCLLNSRWRGVAVVKNSGATLKPVSFQRGKVHVCGGFLSKYMAMTVKQEQVQRRVRCMTQ